MDEKKFTNWAKNYESDIYKLRNEYPFDGYFLIAKEIKSLILKNEYKNILDLGIGTGYMLHLATNTLNKINAVGIDFSEGMLQVSKRYFPNSLLLKFNITNNFIPFEIRNDKFDLILLTYVLHHFNDKIKINIIKRYLKLISKKGTLIIGDISFATKKDFLLQKEKEKDGWDQSEEDGYFISDYFLEICSKNQINITYKKISDCAGLYILNKDEQNI